jgi:hypothetical protein
MEYRLVKKSIAYLKSTARETRSSFNLMTEFSSKAAQNRAQHYRATRVHSDRFADGI